MEQLSRVAGRSRVGWVVLGGAFAVAAVLRALGAVGIPTPWLLPDETAYALRGPSAAMGVLYPLVADLSPELLRVLQALVLCATAFVVYAWARSLVPAVLTLALPGLAYAGTITAQALFLPLATLAGWLAIRAVALPSLRRQAELVAALGVCALTSGETNMLALALLAAALVVRRVRALWPTWAALVGMCAIWLGLGGGPPLRSLGSYGYTGSYSAHGVVDFALEHAVDVLLVSGVLPLCAAVLLALTRPAGIAVRATVAYALALVVVASVEVGAFASGHAGRLLERELLFVLPPLFVAFAAWLDRGAPRPLLRTLAVAAVAVGSLLAVPFGRLATAAVAPDNPSLVPLTHLGSPKVYGVVALVSIGAVVLLLTVRAHALWLMPALVAGALVATSVSAAEEFRDRSDAVRAAYVAPTANWIDRATTGPVTYLYDGATPWQTVWEQRFWNGRLTRVLDLPATRVPGPLPQSQLQILADDGEFRLVGGALPNAPLVVAPTGFGFRGHRIASDARQGLTLWQVDQPARLRTWVQGLRANGDLAQGGVATLDVFDCGAGTFHVVAVGRDNETVRLTEGGAPVAETQLWPGGIWEQSIATHGSGGRCTFALNTTSIVHLQTFTWTPR